MPLSDPRIRFFFLMTTANLPPQAYTRETLAAAFEWLKTQPDSVKQLASSSDILVGLYLQFRRRKQEGFGPIDSRVDPLNEDAPVSGEQFKSELKNLAQGLEQFTEPKLNSSMASPSHVMKSAPKSSVRTAPPRETPPSLGLGLDPQSRDRLLMIQQKLNLSSETEAVRLLISLGFDKIQDILPRTP